MSVMRALLAPVAKRFHPSQDMDWSAVFGGQAAIAGMPAPSIGESLALLPAYPNPFAGSVQLRFTVPSDTGLPTSVTIHDVQGRLVARPVAAEQLASGVHQVEWDGRTEDGRPASAGVFFVRLSQGGMEQTQRVTLLR